MTYDPNMQKGSLDAVAPDVHGKISKQTVALNGVSVTRVKFDVGAKWSIDLQHYAGTKSCLLPHVALVLSGTLRVKMDDGSEEDFTKNEVMLLPRVMMHGPSATNLVSSWSFQEEMTIMALTCID